MFRGFRAAIILLAALVICQVTFSIPCTCAQDNDSVRIHETFSLMEQEHAAFNLTCHGERGYYGSAMCSHGEIALSIVDTAHLAEFLRGDSSPENEWRNQSIIWEYPCPETRNVTFVVQIETGGSTQVTLVVVEDRTPVVVTLTVSRVALYLPKYIIDFTFYGNFFDGAFANLSDAKWQRWLYRNESIQWNAFTFEENISTQVPLPDGTFSMSVRVIEKSGRVTEYTLPIVKRSNQEVISVMFLVFVGAIVSLVTETLRRFYCRRKLARNLLIHGA